jgi:hypothetical protein
MSIIIDMSLPVLFEPQPAAKTVAAIVIQVFIWTPKWEHANARGRRLSVSETETHVHGENC